jgi:hypothetical protein
MNARAHYQPGFFAPLRMTVRVTHNNGQQRFIVPLRTIDAMIVTLSGSEGSLLALPKNAYFIMSFTIVIMCRVLIASSEQSVAAVYLLFFILNSL